MPNVEPPTVVARFTPNYDENRSFDKRRRRSAAADKLIFISYYHLAFCAPLAIKVIVMTAARSFKSSDTAGLKVALPSKQDITMDHII